MLLQRSPARLTRAEVVRNTSSITLLRPLAGRAVVGNVEAAESGRTHIQAVQEAAGLTVLVCKLPHCHKLLYGQLALCHVLLQDR